MVAFWVSKCELKWGESLSVFLRFITMFRYSFSKLCTFSRDRHSPGLLTRIMVVFKLLLVLGVSWRRGLTTQTFRSSQWLTQCVQRYMHWPASIRTKTEDFVFGLHRLPYQSSKRLTCLSNIFVLTQLFLNQENDLDIISPLEYNLHKMWCYVREDLPTCCAGIIVQAVERKNSRAASQTQLVTRSWGLASVEWNASCRRGRGKGGSIARVCLCNLPVGARLPATASSPAFIRE